MNFKEMGRQEKRKRIGMALAGVMITGFCVGAFQVADLGVDPFTCFVTGIANLCRSQYSTFFVILTGILLIGVWFVDRHYIGIATIFNLFGIGYMADLMHWILDQIFPEPTLLCRALILLVSLFILCLASSLYFTADLGVSAYDAWALIAAHKYKLAAFRGCRIVSDCICVAVGLIGRVVPGIGTIATALLMGPIIQWFNTHVSEPFLYGAEGKPAR